MEVSRVIFEATAVCLQSFTDCLAVEALMTDEWAENRLADFNLWVSGIGASARGRASLDSRMALKPEAREVIANLLRLLAGVVDECKKLALSETTNLLSESSHDGELRGRLATLSPEEPPARSFSPWSDDSASDTQSETEFKPLSSGNPLRENMQNIEMMLDQLSRIAVAVRRSGRRSRLQKADQRFKSEEHEDLQKHLITILLARPEFSKEQIEPSKLSKVQQRLIYCNLKRRNRFLYAQQHSKWLDPDTAGRPIETIGTRPPTDGEAAKEKQKKPSSEATDARINPTIRTGTSASAVSDSLALPQALIPAPAASTVMSSTVIDIKYPSPPKIKEGARVFACPCCCQTLPVNLSEENRWKKHVADDLSPYTCILPECVKPEVLFVTKEIWRQHLLKEHRSFEYWVCFACGDGTQLHSEDAFTIHTRTKHAASVPPDQISLLTNICRRTAPIEIRSCPLCNWPEGEEGEVDKDVLLDHIAKDIHSFSLRALPWADDNGQETDERINHSADKVYDWLIKNNLSENPDKERPSREKKVYTSEYFQRNAYFASSSVASSSSELESVASWEEELKKWKQKES
ncbi:uncharacterized protein K441DRAFT_587699, partial [Cenococcum geophilum 1.58]|uniref:uncharacterized protein n=1 Tax=Cenococcum geophilum 1.58 TaxID=794803 RepID=UPI0035901ECF